ncbi:SET domain-containing protein [Bacteroidota bacterium]
MNDIVIKKSKINGLGVFANRDFNKGEIVLKWDTSHILTKEQVAELSENEKKYTLTYEKGKFLLLHPPERFVNHSCDANTAVENYCDAAIKKIKKGEEITSDYTKYDEFSFNIICNCGSKNCRGIVCKSVNKKQ